MPEPITPEQLARHLEVLNTSNESAELAASAVALAASEDREALVSLARILRAPGFLARLEGADGQSTSDVTNLADVCIALAQHPTEFTGRLCELLYGEPTFQELPARFNALLHALGAVKPVTPRAAEIFRETSAAGFAQVNGPILLANSEPPALAVFAEIITGEWVESYVKVDILHRSLLPVRDRLPIVQMCIRLLTSPLDPEVRAALIETLHDFRSKDWFGPAMYAPEPPDWNHSPDASLELLTRLDEKLLTENLSPYAQSVIRRTREEIATILRSRRQ
jgi:hypothetical protein